MVGYFALRIGKMARKRPHLIAWANQQLELRPLLEDWESVIFSDETWATNDPMWKQWITVWDDEDPEDWALLCRNP